MALALTFGELLFPKSFLSRTVSSWEVHCKSFSYVTHQMPVFSSLCCPSIIILNFRYKYFVMFHVLCQSLHICAWLIDLCVNNYTDFISGVLVALFLKWPPANLPGMSTVFNFHCRMR